MKRRWPALVAAAAVLAGGPVAAEDAPDPAAMGAAAAAALADVTRRLGPDTRLLSIEVHRDEVAVSAQDPRRPDHVDRHVYRPGEAAAAEPVAVGRSLRRLKARLFRTADVDAALLPRMIASAAAEVKAEEGVATHAVLERDEGESSWGAPRWRVHVAGPRGGGSVEYGLDGRRRRVLRW